MICSLYNPVTNVWTTGPSLPDGVIQPFLVNIRGIIHLFGGFKYSTFYKQILVLRSDLSGWDVHPEELTHGVDNAIFVVYNE